MNNDFKFECCCGYGDSVFSETFFGGAIFETDLSTGMIKYIGTLPGAIHNKRNVGCMIWNGEQIVLAPFEGDFFWTYDPPTNAMRILDSPPKRSFYSGLKTDNHIYFIGRDEPIIADYSLDGSIRYLSIDPCVKKIAPTSIIFSGAFCYHDDALWCALYDSPYMLRYCLRDGESHFIAVGDEIHLESIAIIGGKFFFFGNDGLIYKGDCSGIKEIMSMPEDFNGGDGIAFNSCICTREDVWAIPRDSNMMMVTRADSVESMYRKNTEYDLSPATMIDEKKIVVFDDKNDDVLIFDIKTKKMGRRKCRIDRSSRNRYLGELLSAGNIIKEGVNGMDLVDYINCLTKFPSIIE